MQRESELVDSSIRQDEPIAPIVHTVSVPPIVVGEVDAVSCSVSLNQYNPVSTIGPSCQVDSMGYIEIDQVDPEIPSQTGKLLPVYYGINRPVYPEEGYNVEIAFEESRHFERNGDCRAEHGSGVIQYNW